MKLKRTQCVSGSSLLEVVIASLLIATTFILFSGFVANVVFRSNIINRMEFLMSMKVINASYGASLRADYPRNQLEMDYQSWRSNEGVIVRVYDSSHVRPLITLYQLKNGLTGDSFFCTFIK